MPLKSTHFALALALFALPALAACHPVVAPPVQATAATAGEPTGDTSGNPAAGPAVEEMMPTMTEALTTTSDNQADPAVALPGYAADLAAAYGPPSQAAFGSAVFYEPQFGDGDLPAAALAKYKYFVGDLWERYGEEAWMGPWRQVYTRPPGGERDVVAELRALDDPAAAQSASMILDGVDNAEQARAALAAAFDDPAVSDVAVFTLGDGEAMSGILLAGRRASTGEAIFLVFLLD